MLHLDPCDKSRPLTTNMLASKLWQLLLLCDWNNKNCPCCVQACLSWVASFRATIVHSVLQVWWKIFVHWEANVGEQFLRIVAKVPPLETCDKTHFTWGTKVLHVWFCTFGGEFRRKLSFVRNLDMRQYFYMRRLLFAQQLFRFSFATPYACINRQATIHFLIVWHCTTVRIFRMCLWQH